MMTSAVTFVFENWMKQQNVEALVCWLPNYADVIEGKFVISAFGNDMTVVSVWTTFEHGYNQSPFADVGVLAVIRGGLAQARSEEATGA